MALPNLRKGPSGPFDDTPAPGADFEPFDNEIYFDPNYVGGAENGSIAGPFLTWDDWVAAIGDDSWRVMFPGVSVAFGTNPIPLTEDNNIVLEGVKGSIGEGTFISGTTQILNDPEAGSVEFKYLGIEALELNGGEYDLIFTNCLVGDVLEAGGVFSGTIYGFNSSFDVLTQMPDSVTVRLTGGNLLDLTAGLIYLSDLTVGAVNGSASGDVTSIGPSGEGSGEIHCHNVTFITGSTITFIGDVGELFLDPPSYKSFLDNDIALTNGHVTRSDGSWPRDAIVYPPSTVINFAKNPRAILEIDNGFTINFTDPLTREVQLLVIQDGIGGHVIDWGPDIRWSDGTPPEQDTTAGSITLYRFDFEETLGYYIGWVPAMNALPEP